jgi:hypothetical protein
MQWKLTFGIIAGHCPERLRVKVAGPFRMYHSSAEDAQGDPEPAGSRASRFDIRKINDRITCVEALQSAVLNQSGCRSNRCISLYLLLSPTNCGAEWRSSWVRSRRIVVDAAGNHQNYAVKIVVFRLHFFT